MVVRKEKRNRKYFGTRRWGAGNIKNARGTGDRGGVGNAGVRKHKFTRMTAKHPELLRKKGFTVWKSKKLKYITLEQIGRISAAEGKTEFEFRNYKVLSNGNPANGMKIKATSFTKKAEEKIKASHGEAIKI